MAPGRDWRSAAVVAVSLLGSSLAVAQPIAPYLVTASPIKTHAGSLGVCIAIDPLDPHGVWWWEPGASGCATRSTGPDVFRANGATVSRPRPGLTTVEYRQAIHSIDRPYVDVRLILDGGRLRATETGSQVDVEGRQDLDVPWELPRARQPVP